MIEVIEAYVRSQADNQMMSAGLATVLLGALLALLRNAPGRIFSMVERRVITTVDISDHDPSFYWVQTWLSEQPYTKRARLLTASTRASLVGHQDDGRDTKVIFSPAPGLHLLRFNRHFLLMGRARREIDFGGDVSYRETITFRALSRDSVRDLIYAAREAAFPPSDKSIGIKRLVGYDWQTAQRRMPRPLSSVVIAGRISESIHADLEWFFGAEQWYADRGIPYQRGYLLTGPPGNGKTSLVTAMAGAFSRDIYMMTMAGMYDDKLQRVMADIPEHSVVLIEDVDCIFSNRKADSERLSFSVFLNTLDGLSSAPGRVLFMTTNHPEQLDRALTRPGRADKTFVIGNATPAQAEQIFLQFFPGRHELATEFGAQLVQDVSMATLQEHLLTHRDEPYKAAWKAPMLKLVDGVES